VHRIGVAAVAFGLGSNLTGTGDTECDVARDMTVNTEFDRHRMASNRHTPNRKGRSRRRQGSCGARSGRTGAERFCRWAGPFIQFAPNFKRCGI